MPLTGAVMPQDRSPLDHLPDDGAADALSARRQRQILLALLSVLLVVGAVVVLVLLASQREPVPGGTVTDDPGTSSPTAEPSATSTPDADLDAALADLDSSRSTLETAVLSADELLRATDGKVADPASRTGLVDALAVAQSALDADVDRTRLSDVQTATTRLRATTASLQHAAGIVADSHEEWLLQQQPPPTSTPVGPAPGPTVDPLPLPVPTGPGGEPGPLTPPDRTPRPGPQPIPIPDDQR